LTADRLRLASRRRRRLALVGRVGLRGAGGTAARRIKPISRSNASVRLRC
jgi:hypothetical protein